MRKKWNLKEIQISALFLNIFEYNLKSESSILKILESFFLISESEKLIN